MNKHSTTLGVHNYYSSTHKIVKSAFYSPHKHDTLIPRINKKSHTHACAHACMHTHIHIHRHTCTNTHTQTHTHKHKCMHMHTFKLLSNKSCSSRCNSHRSTVVDHV